MRKVIKLPSGRTLRDYTHIYESKLGFQKEVDQQVYDEFKVDELKEWQKYVGITFDEMRIKDKIVYNKHSCELIGYVNLGDITNQLLQFEKLCNDEESDVDTYTPPVAQHINCFMVRGLFRPINFPYAHFATRSLSSDEIFPLAWESVKRLELIGLKVVFLTADGASCNRKFIKMHGKKKGVYKTPNIYSNDGRYIYIFVDVPHLLKTTRNCFSNSFGHTRTRALWVSS